MLGDCLERMKELPDNSVDAIVTDPPYGLNFMNSHWDYDVPSVDVWQQCLRILKPGGHLLSFSGSRTYHRMVVAIEDAGFEIRDQVMWVYGSGFPKSHNLNSDWQGWGSALKPAHEPICLARKPLIGTIAENVLTHGVGGLNIDACRVEPTGESKFRVMEASQNNRYNNTGATNFSAKPGVRGGSPTGRWPANFIHDGSEQVLALFPNTKSGTLTPEMNVKESSGWSGGSKENRVKSVFKANEGSAARFFYCAKTSKQDRGEGNNHPTVKPTDLMRYLVKLITPPNGTILDPFMGSGSTGKAAALEGFKFIGIEKEPQYFEIASQRIKEAGLQATLFDFNEPPQEALA